MTNGSSGAKIAVDTTQSEQQLSLPTVVYAAIERLADDLSQNVPAPKMRGVIIVQNRQTAG